MDNSNLQISSWPWSSSNLLIPDILRICNNYAFGPRYVIYICNLYICNMHVRNLVETDAIYPYWVFALVLCYFSVIRHAGKAYTHKIFDSSQWNINRT